MHSAVIRVQDSVRGCGWRQEGGLYIVGGEGVRRGCGKLPAALDLLNKCPCCGCDLPLDYQIKFSRAPRMLHNPELLFAQVPCNVPPNATNEHAAVGGCKTCPLSNAYESGPALLVWIGEQHYPTWQEYSAESKRQGFSRRIPQIPDGFVVGETWVLLAHAKVIPGPVKEITHDPKTGQMFMTPKLEQSFCAGIFSMFKPDRIEMPVSETITDEEVEKLIKRGITPVLIERVGDDGKAAQDEEGEE